MKIFARSNWQSITLITLIVSFFLTIVSDPQAVQSASKSALSPDLDITETLNKLEKNPSSKALLPVLLGQSSPDSQESLNKVTLLWQNLSEQDRETLRWVNPGIAETLGEAHEGTPKNATLNESETMRTTSYMAVVSDVSPILEPGTNDLNEGKREAPTLNFYEKRLIEERPIVLPEAMPVKEVQPIEQKPTNIEKKFQPEEVEKAEADVQDALDLYKESVGDKKTNQEERQAWRNVVDKVDVLSQFPKGAISPEYRGLVEKHIDDRDVHKIWVKVGKTIYLPEKEWLAIDTRKHQAEIAYRLTAKNLIDRSKPETQKAVEQSNAGATPEKKSAKGGAGGNSFGIGQGGSTFEEPSLPSLDQGARQETLSNEGREENGGQERNEPQNSEPGVKGPMDSNGCGAESDDHGVASMPGGGEGNNSAAETPDGGGQVSDSSTSGQADGGNDRAIEGVSRGSGDNGREGAEPSHGGGGQVSDSSASGQASGGNDGAAGGTSPGGGDNGREGAEPSQGGGGQASDSSTSAPAGGDNGKAGAAPNNGGGQTSESSAASAPQAEPSLGN